MTTSPIAILLLTTTWAQERAEPSGWTTLTSNHGGFRVSFPARPQVKSDVLRRATGTTQQTTHSLKTGGCLFTMQQVRYPRPFPPAQVPAQLAAEKKGYLQGQVELIRQEEVTVDGVHGEELEYKGPSPLGKGSVTSRTRHFINQYSYYYITAMSAPDQPLPPEAQRFLDSLQFTGAGTATANVGERADAGARSGASRGRRGSMAKTPGDAAVRSAADDAPDGTAKRIEADLRQLEGTWRLVSSVANGRVIPPDIIGENRIIYEDGRKTVRVGNQVLVRNVKVTLDPTADPKQITESTSDNRGRVKAVHGIYQLEGDTLMTCITPAGKRAPRAFESKPGSGTTLQVFQRDLSDDPAPKPASPRRSRPSAKARRKPVLLMWGNWW